MQSRRHSAATSRQEAAEAIAGRTAAVAFADSRFGRDVSQFIPSFEGADLAARGLLATAECQGARWVLATPDNGLAFVRQKLLQRGVDLIVPSYGLHRGFLRVEAASVPLAAAPYAGWLDGIEHFGVALGLEELKACGRIDLIVTGASAVTAAGLRFGMGGFYLDIEWAVLRGLGVVDDRTPVAAVVHDVQVSEEDLPIRATDVTADLIVTPTRTLRPARRPRPAALDWSIVPDSLRRTETLEAFARLQAR